MKGSQPFPHILDQGRSERKVQTLQLIMIWQLLLLYKGLQRRPQVPLKAGFKPLIIGSLVDCTTTVHQSELIMLKQIMQNTCKLFILEFLCANVFLSTIQSFNFKMTFMLKRPIPGTSSTCAKWLFLNSGLYSSFGEIGQCVSVCM